MKNFIIDFFKSDRFKLIWLLYAVIAGISFLTRIILLIHSGDLVELTFGGGPKFPFRQEIDYENVWGVADENPFTLSLREIDKTINSGKTVLVHIMTTSNHRPFTYPEGRIDIPSHSGRDGAVKYKDYAIGKFIREASKKIGTVTRFLLSQLIIVHPVPLKQHYQSKTIKSHC